MAKPDRKVHEEAHDLAKTIMLGLAGASFAGVLTPISAGPPMGFYSFYAVLIFSATIPINLVLYMLGHPALEFEAGRLSMLYLGLLGVSSIAVVAGFGLLLSDFSVTLGISFCACAILIPAGLAAIDHIFEKR